MFTTAVRFYRAVGDISTPALTPAL